MDREDWVGVLYLIGIAIDWTYWVAKEIENDTVLALAVVKGILPAIFWPLHLLVEGWLWILS